MHLVIHDHMISFTILFLLFIQVNIVLLEHSIPDRVLYPIQDALRKQFVQEILPPVCRCLKMRFVTDLLLNSEGFRGYQLCQ